MTSRTIPSLAAFTFALAVRAQEPAVMTLTSPAFADSTPIPTRYTRDGEGISPPLAWSNVPPGTKSFVLHVHDINTPQELRTSRPTRVHWLVWNIPAGVTALPEGATPAFPPLVGSRQASVHGSHYVGPGRDQNLLESGAVPKAAYRANRPPPAVHRYRFEIFALDIVLDVPRDKDAAKTRASLILAMNGHVLGQGGLTGLFEAVP